MMSKAAVQTDRQAWGWLAAGMLFLALVAPLKQAWALDLERENAQILATLGHDKQPNQVTSSSTRKTVQLHLVRRAKRRPHVVVR